MFFILLEPREGWTPLWGFWGAPGPMQRVILDLQHMAASAL